MDGQGCRADGRGIGDVAMASDTATHQRAKHIIPVIFEGELSCDSFLRLRKIGAQDCNPSVAFLKATAGTEDSSGGHRWHELLAGGVAY